MDKPPRKHTSLLQKIAIRDKLQEVLRNVGDGQCIYIDGWSDDRVREVVTPEFTSTAPVAHIRLSMFGKLIATTTGPQDERIAQLEAAVSELQEVISRIERETGSLAKRVDLIGKFQPGLPLVR